MDKLTFEVLRNDNLLREHTAFWTLQENAGIAYTTILRRFCCLYELAPIQPQASRTSSFLGPKCHSRCASDYVDS